MLNEHDLRDLTPDVEVDPLGKDQHEPGAKLDSGKVLPWLFITGFANAMNAIAEVVTIGAKKYSPHGWSFVPDGSNRYMEAFGRHTLKLASGERYDNDTGCLHKVQMIWNLLASLELDLREELEKVKNEQTGFTGETKKY